METKSAVRFHYEEYGWHPAAEQGFNERRFVDPRRVMAGYYARSHAEAGQVFQKGGRYFLDAGCGGHPMQDYGRSFDRHVGVDFSPLGLRQARQRLGRRGLYVIADVVHLPFKPGSFDGAVNAYNLFHVPAEEQPKAVGELARVLRPGQPGVILYGRATSRLVAAIRNPLVRRLPILRSLKHRLLGTVAAPPEVFEPYYFAYPPRWFRLLLAGLGVDEAQIRCLRLVDERVTRRLIPDTRLGHAVVAGIVALERWFPRALAPLASHYVVTFRR